jgi:hypothetical protein
MNNNPSSTSPFYEYLVSAFIAVLMVLMVLCSG